MPDPSEIEAMEHETEYVHSVVIAVPEALIADANQLALCLGESPDDDQTFGPADWIAADGSAQSLQHTRVKAWFVTAATGSDALVTPDHAPGTDLTAAERAKATLSMTGPARADAIVAILDASRDDALTQLGLSR